MTKEQDKRLLSPEKVTEIVEACADKGFPMREVAWASAKAQLAKVDKVCPELDREKIAETIYTLLATEGFLVSASPSSPRWANIGHWRKGKYRDFADQIIALFPDIKQAERGERGRILKVIEDLNSIGFPYGANFKVALLRVLTQPEEGENNV